MLILTVLKIIFLTLNITEAFLFEEEYTQNGPLQLPFVVSIQKTEMNGTNTHQCVGGIIHKKFVLTAAHCFYTNNDIKKLSIAPGNYHLSLNDNKMHRKVIRVVSHSKYMPLFGYDFAIIEVQPEFDFSDKNFQKLRYENISIESVSNGYLAGWGGVHMDLQLVPFKLFANDRCRKMGFNHVTSSEFCAYSPKGRGACAGDSGGPLVSPDLKEVIGVLSYGKTACEPKRLFVFGSVQYLGTWIKKQISNMLSGMYSKMGIIKV